MPFELSEPPAQPGEDTWAFVRELAETPVHGRVRWTRRDRRRDEADLGRGVRVVSGFPDPEGLLETVFDDFARFLSCGEVPFRNRGTRSRLKPPNRVMSPDCRPDCCDGFFEIRLSRDGAFESEAFELRVHSDSCDLVAGDTEGVRRGLIWIEDEMQRRGGPFLPLGEFRRAPWVRTRLSRCFYGPINRPPKSRDELADDVDYYPEEYLNRLAHEGVNGLWLTVHFFQTVPSKIIPEYGRDAGPRLDKLRRTVAKCKRHGIRIYPFCIEPAGFNWSYPEVQTAVGAHPELRGHLDAFCTSTEKGLAYVEEASRTLFSEVPDLGGLVVIPVGERLTHCYSSSIEGGPRGAGPNRCPRCAKREPREVLADTLAAFRRGIDAVSPGADLIAWPYGQFICWGADKTVDAAGHMPEGVTLQHNFETGGHNVQLGKERATWDYWLSYPGPSDLFRRCAEAARANGTRTSAKLQVGCSHEVATTQVVPVPGILHEKYAAMRDLGVGAAMHSWYFGSYPSLMTRAAGELSFGPFPAKSGEFLKDLARRDWADAADEVVRAWRHFERGYRNYPTTHVFGYYGPMHDAPAWPLYLEPRRLPLAPTWQLPYPPSGDYIAECVTSNFTLGEMVTLCRRMSAHWDKGVAILRGLRRRFAGDSERLRDIGVAEALGLQFRSGYHILRFYQLRERLADARKLETRARLLGEMKRIVREEMQISRALIPLAEADSCLGFHSEAEGYKYHPEKLRWRIEMLRRLLDEEFPEVAKRAKMSGPLFPDYTGEGPAGEWLEWTPADRADDAPRGECVHGLRSEFSRARWKHLPQDALEHSVVAPEAMAGRKTTWHATYDDEAVTFGVACAAGDMEGFGGNGLEVWIEPVRTKPRVIFSISPVGAARCQRDAGYIPRDDNPWEAVSRIEGDVWYVSLRVPLDWLRGSPRARLRPMRVNVLRTMPMPDGGGAATWSWVARHPAQGRLVWGTTNPATDFGWLRRR